MDGDDPRFRINTAPGVMEPKFGVNEAHGSYLQRHTAVELRDELTAWLEAHPTEEELRDAERKVWWQQGYDAAKNALPDGPRP